MTSALSLPIAAARPDMVRLRPTVSLAARVGRLDREGVPSQGNGVVLESPGVATRSRSPFFVGFKRR
jgi:hypothetical protein